MASLCSAWPVVDALPLTLEGALHARPKDDPVLIGSLALLGLEDAALTGAPLPAVRPAGSVDAAGESVQCELVLAETLSLVCWLWTGEGRAGGRPAVGVARGAGPAGRGSPGMRLRPLPWAALLPRATPLPSRGWGSSSCVSQLVLSSQQDEMPLIFHTQTVFLRVLHFHI